MQTTQDSDVDDVPKHIMFPNKNLCVKMGEETDNSTNDKPNVVNNEKSNKDKPTRPTYDLTKYSPNKIGEAFRMITDTKIIHRANVIHRSERIVLLLYAENTGRR